MADDPQPAPRSRAARLRQRLRDRNVRFRTAVLILLAAGVIAGVLASVAATIFAPRPRPPGPHLAEERSCEPERIQSLESWTLARLPRAPVAAPKKQLWEKTFSSPAAAQTAIKDRLVGWPTRRLADRSALPRGSLSFAKQVARDTWRGLDALSDREHGLPLDTVTFGDTSVARDVSHAGDYTSTTNIGLHLVDVVAAMDLALITRDEAAERVRRTLTTLQQLETDNGLFFNYYDTTSLERTSNFVSFVDLAWLSAGLMTVRMAFPEFYEHCSALIEQISYRPFYDEGVGLISHGYFIEPRAPSRYHYGVLYTEARLGTLIAIGKGDIPEAVWFAMTRTFPENCHWQSMPPIDVREKTVQSHTFTAGFYEWDGARYVPSWGGSMFEALMPTLVLDEAAAAPHSLGANDRAHALIQRRYALHDLRLPVWGLSPSATPGSEQYGEYGVKHLGSLGYPSGPVTPHASALAIGIIPRAAIANLHRLVDRFDVYGDFGFYDAVDPATGRVAYKYLTLDQSMLFIALANHLTDRAVQRRFTADPIIQRVLPMLAAESFFE